jgi:NitT/TauT family transport system substrate-binding protein
MQVMPNGGAIPPGLLSESLQIGALTAPSVIQAKAAGIPLKIITGGTVVTKANPNGTVIVRTGVDVKSAKDLEGKRVGTGGIGSYFNVLMQQWLIDNGADPAKVSVIEVPFSQMTDVLRSGQIDAATVGHPYWDRMETEGIGKSFVPFTGEFSDGLLSNIYVVTEDYIAKNPKVPGAFSAAIEEANQLIEAHPDQARESAAKFLKLPADALAALPLSNYRTEVTTEQIKQWNDIMHGQKLIDPDIDPASVLLK